MSEQTKEAALDPDTAAPAITNDGAAQNNHAASSTAIQSDHGNGTIKGNISNGAVPAQSGQESSESNLKAQKEDPTSYGEDSKGNYSKRQNKSKYDPNAEPVPEDAATRAQKIRNLVCFSNGIIVIQIANLEPWFWSG